MRLRSMYAISPSNQDIALLVLSLRRNAPISDQELEEDVQRVIDWLEARNKLISCQLDDAIRIIHDHAYPRRAESSG